MNYKLKVFFPIAVICAFFFLYTSCKHKNTIPKPDVSKINVDVQFIRFENTLFRANGKNYREVLDSLQNNYPGFYKLFVQDVLNMQPETDSAYSIYDTLYKYMITDKYMLRLYDSVELIYKNISDVEKDLEQAFKYYTYYFPDSTLPRVYTYIAPFVYQVVLGDSVLGIELNMFLGQHFSYYSSFAANMPEYLLYRFQKKNIAVSVMRTLMEGNIPGKNPDATLLEEMISEGKMMYYLDLMLPDTPDSVKIGFTSKQIAWCEYNAEDIWKFFAGEDILFSKRTQDKERYIGESPSSYGMPPEAPGRTAIWVGWQIVREYMRKNKNVSVQQLFEDTDALKILKESNYEPEKK